MLHDVRKSLWGLGIFAVLVACLVGAVIAGWMIYDLRVAMAGGFVLDDSDRLRYRLSCMALPVPLVSFMTLAAWLTRRR